MAQRENQIIRIDLSLPDCENFMVIEYVIPNDIPSAAIALELKRKIGQVMDDFEACEYIR